MAQVTTGANRLFGGTTMGRMSELRRQAAVAVSETKGLIPADSDFPTLVSVKRQEKTSAGAPSAGVSPSWSTVAGLSGLKGHVRTNGEWTDSDTGQRIKLGEAERVVLIVDVPAGGNGLADEVLLTDRLTFVDPMVGVKVWDVRAVHIDKRDGVVSCRVNNAREEIA